MSGSADSLGAARAIARGARLLRHRSQKKNASARSFSARRRAISRHSQLFWERLAQSRVEPACLGHADFRVDIRQRGTGHLPGTISALGKDGLELAALLH
jgi:hypothetical protein